MRLSHLLVALLVRLVMSCDYAENAASTELRWRLELLPGIATLPECTNACKEFSGCEAVAFDKSRAYCALLGGVFNYSCQPQPLHVKTATCTSTALSTTSSTTLTTTPRTTTTTASSSTTTTTTPAETTTTPTTTTTTKTTTTTATPTCLMPANIPCDMPDYACTSDITLDFDFATGEIRCPSTSSLYIARTDTIGNFPYYSWAGIVRCMENGRWATPWTPREYRYDSFKMICGVAPSDTAYIEGCDFPPSPPLLSPCPGTSCSSIANAIFVTFLGCKGLECPNGDQRIAVEGAAGTGTHIRIDEIRTTYMLVNGNKGDVGVYEWNTPAACVTYERASEGALISLAYLSPELSYHIKVINSSARRIGWAFKTTNMKRLGIDPPCGVLDPKEPVLVAVVCDAFAYGQEDTNNDRIIIEWTNTTDGAAKQFRREWFQGDGMVRRKNFPIEYNP